MEYDVKTIIKKLRAFALSLPETREDVLWGEHVLMVMKRVFLFFGESNGADGAFSVRLPNSIRDALVFPFTTPTQFGLAKRGWITVALTPDTRVPIEILQNWIQESYRAATPIKLRSRIGEVVPSSEKKKSKANPRPTR